MKNVAHNGIDNSCTHHDKLLSLGSETLCKASEAMIRGLQIRSTAPTVNRWCMGQRSKIHSKYEAVCNLLASTR